MKNPGSMTSPLAPYRLVSPPSWRRSAQSSMPVAHRHSHTEFGWPQGFTIFLVAYPVLVWTYATFDNFGVDLFVQHLCILWCHDVWYKIYIYIHSSFPAWAFVACDPTWWYMMSLVMWRNVTGVLVSPFVGLEIADGLGIAFAWMQLTCCGGHRFAMPAKMHQTSGCKPSPTRDVGVQILNLAHRFSIPCELLDAISGDNVMPCAKFLSKITKQEWVPRITAGFQSSCYIVFWSNIFSICFPSSLRKTF